MQIEFSPIPPDTLSSLEVDLRRTAREFGLLQYVSSCSAFASVLEMSAPPDAENLNEFLSAMRKICEVRIRPEKR